jgi:intron-binding protein aquarius
LVVRRKAKENNFKAVLETIRDLMKNRSEVNRSIPPWLHDVLLGHGDVSSASYSSCRMRRYAINTVGVTNPNDPLDYGDTFVDEDHLQDSYVGRGVCIKKADVVGVEGGKNLCLPFSQFCLETAALTLPFDVVRFSNRKVQL